MALCGCGAAGALRKVFITAFQTELSPENDIWRGRSCRDHPGFACATLFSGVASTRTLFAAPGAGYNPLTVDEEVAAWTGWGRFVF